MWKNSFNEFMNESFYRNYRLNILHEVYFCIHFEFYSNVHSGIQFDNMILFDEEEFQWYSEVPFEGLNDELDFKVHFDVHIFTHFDEVLFDNMYSELGLNVTL